MTLPRFGAIWDMDGVLIDNAEQHYAAWCAILPVYGLSFPREQFLATFGTNNQGVLRMLLGRDPTAAMYEEIGSRKEANYRRLVAERIEAAPGAVEWLSQFRQAGIPQAMATSAPVENIDVVVDTLGIRHYFDAIVSGLEMPTKPAPDVYLEAARRIDMPPQRCIVFEDAIPGVAGAKAAGMKCIAVTNTNPALALAAADVVVESLAELTEDVVRRLAEVGATFVG